METKDKLEIYEYCDQHGFPSQYTCEGHIDSVRFREECQRIFSAKPLVIQHRWQRTKRISVRHAEKKFARSFTTEVLCTAYEKGAQAVTIGRGL